MYVVKRSKNSDLKDKVIWWKEKEESKRSRPSTSPKLYIRLVDERQPVLLEQLQKDNESVCRPPWRESASKRRGRTTRPCMVVQTGGGAEHQQRAGQDPDREVDAVHKTHWWN